MSLIKQYFYELKEMIDTCQEQDQYIKEVLMATDPEDWSGVEHNYTLDTNENTIKN